MADLIVGAPNGDPTSGGTDAGRSYVIFGNTSGSSALTAVDQLGTSGNDTITGSTSSETLVGGAGNDTIYGNGGADVIYGGSGNDIIVLNSDNVAKLAVRVTGGNLARVDGGSGIDTLRLLDPAGVVLDLTLVANQGGATPDGYSRIESIERIDLVAGSSNNTLILNVRDVLDMSDDKSTTSGHTTLTILGDSGIP